MKHLSKNLASVETGLCVACGCCLKVCPRQAISICKGIFAAIDQDACVGCGRCRDECPASVISILPRSQSGCESGLTGGICHESV